MAFVVEDGSRLSDATAYMTVEQWKDHHLDRGIDSANDGTWSDTEIESGIVNATDYIDKRFGKRFRGWRSSSQQSLEWPRTDAFDNDDYWLTGVPSQILKATAEYGLIVLQLGRNLAPIPGVGFPITDPATGETEATAGTGIKRTTEKVGPLEDTTEYFAGTDANQPMTSTGNLIQSIPEYPQADLWIEELLISSTSRTIIRG